MRLLENSALPVQRMTNSRGTSLQEAKSFQTLFRSQFESLGIHGENTALILSKHVFPDNLLLKHFSSKLRIFQLNGDSECFSNLLLVMWKIESQTVFAPNYLCLNTPCSGDGVGQKRHVIARDISLFLRSYMKVKIIDWIRINYSGPPRIPLKMK